MKVKDGFILRCVAGQNIVIPVGEEAINFNGMVSFNESGAFLWKALEQEKSREELAQALLLEYEVSEECAYADVDAFVEKLRKANLINE